MPAVSPLVIVQVVAVAPEAVQVPPAGAGRRRVPGDGEPPLEPGSVQFTVASGAAEGDARTTVVVPWSGRPARWPG